MSKQDQRAAAYPSSGVSPPAPKTSSVMPGVQPTGKFPAQGPQTFPEQTVGVGAYVDKNGVGGYDVDPQPNCYPLPPPTSPTSPSPTGAFIPVPASPQTAQGQGSQAAVVQVVTKSAANYPRVQG